MSDNRPPLDYLATCSNASLEAFELSRLNRAANFRKEVRDILDDWVEAEGEARFARWLLESRRAQETEMHVSAKQPELPQLPDAQMLFSFFSEPDERVARQEAPGAIRLNLNPEQPTFAGEAPSPTALPLADSTSGATRTPKPRKPRSARTVQTELTENPGGAAQSLGPLAAQAQTDAEEANRSQRSDANLVAEQPVGYGQACNLHPSMQKLVAQPSEGDSFGEAAYAPIVELNSRSPARPLLPAPVREEPEVPAQFRIRFGRCESERDRMKAAS
jgi:hypothetical protein